MKWQDWVFTIGNMALALALIPTVFGPDKPAMLTSGMTSMILILFAFAFGTLGFRKSCIACATSASLWLILLIQAVRL